MGLDRTERTRREFLRARRVQDAFRALKTSVDPGKRLTRLQTLRLAISKIKALQQQLHDDDQPAVEPRGAQTDNVYPNPESCWDKCTPQVSVGSHKGVCGEEEKLLPDMEWVHDNVNIMNRARQESEWRDNDNTQLLSIVTDARHTQRRNSHRSDIMALGQRTGRTVDFRSPTRRGRGGQPKSPTGCLQLGGRQNNTHGTLLGPNQLQKTGT
ncbi:hypothetical protein Bbelb_051030 [Branchiostoma belcheri]|nr:hypothetical protein Bbelb_051030 [Branchiostoma belcheri]